MFRSHSVNKPPDFQASRSFRTFHHIFVEIRFPRRRSLDSPLGSVKISNIPVFPTFLAWGQQVEFPVDLNDQENEFCSPGKPSQRPNWNMLGTKGFLKRVSLDRPKKTCWAGTSDFRIRAAVPQHDETTLFTVFQIQRKRDTWQLSQSETPRKTSSMSHFGAHRHSLCRWVKRSIWEM